MHYLKRDKKDEESSHGYNAYNNLDKTMVLQEARVFNESPVNSKKCLQVLTKILYIVNQNEPIGSREATECFFATTKLFQSKDPILRRMVYLVIKDMASLAQDVIIVTSSLTKDMTGREDMYRGPAIRTLCSITDHTMIQAIERYMKQAIVDKNYTVASAALTSSMHLCKAQGGEIVKRWINELQEAINSDNVMVQYHALGLIYQVKKSDRLAISKLFSKFSKGSLRSPYAYVLLIRISCQLIADDEGSNYANTAPYFDFVESCLRHKSEMVVFEAASALVNMHKPGSAGSKQQLAPAVSVLQLFCSSPNAALRFAAVKTLNKVAMSQPSAVMSCNVDLETLITDSNRSVATLAITTLLKTGSESSIDRLMKQISTFMNEISDPFKITVVKAIQSLCLKFPRKHAVMMNFLSGMLREEGGFDYKKAIVETIVSIIQDNPEAKETGLAHLCEFIEDCEHAVLAVKILHLLGAEGPKTPQPSKYIRYIYNRVILEAPPVRSAAVSALAKFALYCDDDLKASIGVLLSRCLLDTDDEVRDRATYYLTLLGGPTPGGSAPPTEQLMDGVSEDVQMSEDEGGVNANGAQTKMAPTTSSAYIDNEMHISIPCLERSLLNYLAKGDFERESFDLKSVPIEETKPQDSAKGDFGPGPIGLTPEDGAMGFPKKKAEVEMQRASRESLYIETLSKIAAFSTLGPLFKSCAPVKLTEDETEYVVQCIKHIFTNYVVFQFDVTNTLTDQILENLVIAMEPSEEQFHVAKTIAAKECKPSDLQTEPSSGPAVAYTCVRLPEESVLVSCTFTNVMKFKVRDCDPSTGEIGAAAYDDQYTIEDLELGVSDSMKSVAKHNFVAAWEELGAENELEDSFVLSNIKTLEEAVNKLIQFLGMAPCDSSDKIGEGKNLHTLYLSGIYRGGHDILARIKIVVIPETGVTMNMVVRSSDPAASEVLVTAMG